MTDAVQGRWFTTLLTKFSAPEDVFGPLSLPRLEQGVYERLTTGYLPSADLAFLDEIYKANALILNALLSILNELRTALLQARALVEEALGVVDEKTWFCETNTSAGSTSGCRRPCRRPRKKVPAARAGVIAFDTEMWWTQVASSRFTVYATASSDV